MPDSPSNVDKETAGESDTSNRPVMHKRPTRKDDGRSLIYYSFSTGSTDKANANQAVSKAQISTSDTDK